MAVVCRDGEDEEVCHRSTRFLKKWAGLSRPADPSRLYLPKRNGGMELPNIATMYKKTKSSIACQLLTSHNPITQQVTKIRTQKEESQQRAAFRPMLMAREVMAADPGAKCQTLMKLTKSLVATVDAEERLNHAQSLTSQGQLHQLVDDDAVSLWSEVVQKLPPECMKFSEKLASLVNAGSAMNAKHCYTY